MGGGEKKDMGEEMIPTTTKVSRSRVNPEKPVKGNFFSLKG